MIGRLTSREIIRTIEAFRASDRRILGVVLTCLHFAAPLVDLWARFALTHSFFVFGMLKIGDSRAALAYAAHGFPVEFPGSGAITICVAIIALLGPLLIISGLLVRPASIALLVLTIGVRHGHDAMDADLFCAALFGWYATHGAGPLSLDRLLARGLQTSALPFAAWAAAVGHWMDRLLAPAYRLALRVWLAVGLVVASAPAAIFPVKTLATLPPWLAMPTSILLLVGWATPLTAGILAAALAATSMMYPAADVSAFASLLLVLLGVFGAGRFSLDALHWRARTPKVSSGREPHVVIVGGGFGGISCATGLRHERARITLIDRNNYHLFQPLLYQVATAGLSPGDIAAPIRGMFRSNPRLTVIRGTVSGVDTKRSVVFVDGHEISFDYLVLATGASHSYFGNEDWARHAPALKTLPDAIAIRGRILDAFERAEATLDPSERKPLLTFLVCGGGPTGVELAGAIADLARYGFEREFRRFDPSAVRVMLVEAGTRLLKSFPEALSNKAHLSLRQMGVDVSVGKRVEAIDEHGAIVNGERIRASTVLWAAGVTASPAAAWLGETPDHAGRIKVASDLSVPGLPHVFAIGDTASALAWNGAQVPGLAQAAKQEGAYVATVLAGKLRTSAPPPPFHYRHQGSLATIGRKRAVADLGRVKLWGSTAWWLWGAVHVFFLLGPRNRLSVVIGWAWSYFTYRIAVQLITSDGRQAGMDSPAPANLSRN